MKEVTTENNNIVYDIEANVICKKQSHKGIIIGSKGEMLKTIKLESISKLYKTLGCRCKLKLWVKVKENWDEKDGTMSNISDKFC